MSSNLLFESVALIFVFSLSRLLYGWCEGKDRPESGSLVKLNTKDGKTSWDLHTGSLV